MTDYKWQIKAVVRFATEIISAIIAACGTGKTRAGIKIALKKMLPIIVIAPKNIARQWKDDILEIAGQDQDIWLYDMSEETRKGDAYTKSFQDWLKPKPGEIESMLRIMEDHNADR